MLPIGPLEGRLYQCVQRIEAEGPQLWAVTASIWIGGLAPTRHQAARLAHAPGLTLWRANRPSTSRALALPGSSDRGVTVAPAASESDGGPRGPRPTVAKSCLAAWVATMADNTELVVVQPH